MKFKECSHDELREYCIYRSALKCQCVICGEQTTCVDECFQYPVCGPECQIEMNRRYEGSFCPVQSKNE